jgi:ionotropic glutamate receptor
VDIGFERSKIRPYDTPDDFYVALSKGSKNGGISALVHEAPYIKLFLANYSKGYTMVGPIYKSVGFAFVSSTTPTTTFSFILLKNEKKKHYIVYTLV